MLGFARGQCLSSPSLMTSWSLLRGHWACCQRLSVMCLMSAILSSFLTAYRLLGGLGIDCMLSWISISMWSRLIAQFSLGLHLITLLLMPSVTKVKSITLSLVPLLKVASPFGVIGWRARCWVS